MPSRNRPHTPAKSLVPYPLTLLSAAIIAAAPGAHGEDEIQQIQSIRVLGEVEEGFNVALDADMIEARQSSDLEDMLNHDPSITVGGGAPIAQKIYVRGLEDTLLNVTIDGATQSGYLYHHQGRVYVEPELIKNIVIKPGAGNAADGTGALGGAIHFNLKDAQDMLLPGERAGALLKSSYHSNNQGWKNHVSAYGLLGESMGLLASFSRFESDEDYEAGDGTRVEETEQMRQDILLKLSGNLAEDHYISVSYEEYEDEGKRYARSNMGALFHPVYPNIPVDQQTERESWIANYKYNPHHSAIDLSTTLYYTDSQILKQGDEWAETWPIAGPPPTWTFIDYHDGKYHGGGVESLGFDLRNTSVIGKHELVYGLEYRADEAYLVKPAVSDFDEETTDIMALFLQADVTITDSLRLTAGARYDDYDYTDNQGVEINDSGFSPNLTVSVDVMDGLELSAGYAKSFKGVSSPEVFFLEFPPAGTTLASYQGADRDDVVDGFTVGELTAEEADNFEVAFKYEQGPLVASGEIYRQTIENASLTTPTVRYSYVDDVEVDGYALRLGYYWEKLFLNAGVAHSKPELNGEPLSSGDMGLGTAYGRTWTLGLEYDFSETILFGWEVRLVETLDDVQEGQDEKDGYNVHDVFAQWNPLERLTLGLAVNNLFDKFYYDQGSFYTRNNTSDPLGLPEPGRDVRLYLSYQF
ncbi:MAG: TonB-dependent receptor [Candidatus Thiodiazotropha sp. (ex Ctena orbiculata)]|nr:TonB-dependent receptor [Candidatus Thiodiazotropha taylori]